MSEKHSLNITENNDSIKWKVTSEDTPLAVEIATDSNMVAFSDTASEEGAVFCKMQADEASAQLGAGEIIETEKLMENDYNKLKNKPTLDGRIIEGTMKELDPTVPLWAKAEKKPRYIAREVGAVGEEDLVPLSLDDLSILYDAL